jgi:hypothetical protein
MAYIKSNNPHRTEENKHQYDHYEGTFLVKRENILIGRFSFTGNNIQESLENRLKALEKASTMNKAFNGVGISTYVEETD